MISTYRHWRRSGGIRLVRKSGPGKKAAPRKRASHPAPLPAGAPGERGEFHSGESAADRSEPGAQLQEYLGAFEGLVSSFRKEVCKCFGETGEELVARAEEKVRLRTPGFNAGLLDRERVLSVLDLIETIIAQVSIFKRSKLRRAALTQVSELYARHYGILREFQAVDALEQFYYRMKK